jgi:RNA polymerase sigma factor (sigma-70 family)
MTQEELLVLIYEKDEKAFTHLYDMYSKSLFAVINTLVKNREEAEDVLQEVFVKIWKNIDSYHESKGRFYTWIINIARNTSIDKLRSKNFNNSQKNLSSDNFVNLLDDSNKLSHKIDAIGIQEFVKKLKPKCIQIIDLLFFKGYTQQEASEELAIPLGTETENIEIAALAKEHSEINDEIISIEKAIVALSSTFSPFHSVANYEKIKAKLELKYGKVVEMKPEKSRYSYMGWAAAVLLLMGIGYQYRQLNITNNQVVEISSEKENLLKAVDSLGIKNKTIETSLAVIRDPKNTVITLGGQAVSPTSSAKIYWNKETRVVYVDASGLPKPPKGKVYQVWALKLAPVLTPTSIGLLKNFDVNDQKLFAVSDTGYAEAFGITLEPEGGSTSPTMEQLYTLGKV